MINRSQTVHTLSINLRDRVPVVTVCISEAQMENGQLNDLLRKSVDHHQRFVITNHAIILHERYQTPGSILCPDEDCGCGTTKAY